MWKMDICSFQLDLSILPGMTAPTFFLLWFEKCLWGIRAHYNCFSNWIPDKQQLQLLCHLPFKHVMQYSTVLHGQVWVRYFKAKLLKFYKKSKSITMHRKSTDFAEDSLVRGHCSFHTKGSMSCSAANNNKCCHCFVGGYVSARSWTKF